MAKISFEEEYKILVEWFRKKSSEYKEAPVKRGCLDSELSEQYYENTAEYNRRLTELKAKYGMELEDNQDGKKAKGERHVRT